MDWKNTLERISGRRLQTNGLNYIEKNMTACGALRHHPLPFTAIIRDCTHGDCLPEREDMEEAGIHIDFVQTISPAPTKSVLERAALPKQFLKQKLVKSHSGNVFDDFAV